MDNLHCVGTETDLANCEHNGWAQHNCKHSEDVSITCDIGKNNLHLSLLTTTVDGVRYSSASVCVCVCVSQCLSAR